MEHFAACGRQLGPPLRGAPPRRHRGSGVFKKTASIGAGAFRRVSAGFFFLLFSFFFLVFSVGFSYLVVMLAPSLPSLVAGFRSFGFSGSRFGSAAVSPFLSLLPAGAAVSVGCARGVDRLVRAAFPASRVFRAASFRPAALAARSASLVRSVVASGGLLVAFPGGSCPAGVCPRRRSFRGCGSGSWGSVALARALGGAVLVFVPGSGAGFGSLGPCAPGFVPVGGLCQSVGPAGPVVGRWFFAPAVPPPLSLF